MACGRHRRYPPSHVLDDFLCAVDGCPERAQDGVSSGGATWRTALWTTALQAALSALSRFKPR
eukprot:3864703-Alexandrium_andersonii.AAC.1